MFIKVAVLTAIRKTTDTKLRISIVFCCLMSLLACGCLPEGSNRVPDIGSIECPQDIDVDSDVKLVCHADDTDSDSLSYQWQSDYGKITGVGSDATWHSPDESGLYLIKVIVRDGRGGSVSQDIVLPVIDSSYLMPATNLVINLQDSIYQDELTLKTVWVYPASEIAINVLRGERTGSEQVSYTWTTNGGRLVGPGLKEKKAAAVGWYSPGVPGTYYVALEVNPFQGKQLKYIIEFGVKNHHCCE